MTQSELFAGPSCFCLCTVFPLTTCINLHTILAANLSRDEDSFTNSCRLHTSVWSHLSYTCDREIMIPLSSQCENLILDQCRRVNTFDLRCYQTLDFVLVSNFLVIKKNCDTYCLSVRIGKKNHHSP